MEPPTIVKEVSLARAKPNLLTVSLEIITNAIAPWTGCPMQEIEAAIVTVFA